MQAKEIDDNNVNINSTGKNIDILGCQMLNMTMSKAIDKLNLSIESGKKVQVTYLNADCLNIVFKDRDYYNVIKDSELIFPDGIGIDIACKITNQNMIDNLNGTDMFPEICKLSVEKNYSLYFLGARPGVVDSMKKNVEDKFPGINIAGIHHGYFSEDELNDVISEINSLKIDFLFVAMGAPIQEKFIRKNYDRLNCKVMLGVGGLFDFNSGRIKRAPLFIRKIGCEWVWRLLNEPKRLWKRYIVGNFIFLYRVIRYKKNLPN